MIVSKWIDRWVRLFPENITLICGIYLAKASVTSRVKTSGFSKL